MNAPTVQHALSRIAGRKALLVGDFMLDAYIYGQTVRVSREAPVLVVRRERTEHRLGGAANTAANLTALGVKTMAVGLVGDDDGGRTLASLMGDAGVDTSGVLSIRRTTAVKTRILAGAFGISRQQVLRLDDEPDQEVPSELVRRVAAMVEERGRDADVVVASDYGLGLVRGPVIDVLRDLSARGKAVCVDSRYRLAEFAGVTAVTPNVPEAEALVGFELNHPEAAERAGRLICDRLRVGACLLTQGRGGMTLFRPGEPSRHVDIVGDEEVTDVTGAGDTVIATFGACLAAGLGMENGMRLANSAAGIVVTKVGTGTASPPEIESLVTRASVELVPWST